MVDNTTEPTAAQKEPVEPTANEPVKTDKTFTQAELDSLIKDRLERERKKYADYADLKKAKDKLDEIEREKLTEGEKAAKKLKDLEDKIAEKERLLAEKEIFNLKRAKIEQAIADGKMKLPKGRTIDSLVKRMIGSSEDEIDLDLTELMGLFPPDEPTKAIGGGSQQAATKPPDLADQINELTRAASDPNLTPQKRSQIQEQLLALKMKSQGGFKIT